MKRTNLKSTLTGLIIICSMMALLHSCKPKCDRHPDDPECLTNEEEVLTTMKVFAYDSATNALIDTFIFADADNNGTPECFDTIRLGANHTYKVQLQIWNESVFPAEELTGEVESENNDHLFVFHTHGVDIDFVYIDYDTHNPPLRVGLQTYWRTSTAGSGQAHIVLRHQPGVKDGTETPGETDIEVEFPVVLQ